MSSKKILNQNYDFDSLGRGSVGKLNSLEVSLEDASPEDLEKLHIAMGSFAQLVFESGIQVSGTVLNILKNFLLKDIKNKFILNIIKIAIYFMKIYASLANKKVNN
jgi:hypothetical protein